MYKQNYYLTLKKALGLRVGPKAERTRPMVHTRSRKKDVRSEMRILYISVTLNIED